MDALASTRFALAQALAEVLRGWTWRHTGLGLAIGIANIVLGPGGGLLVFPAPEASKSYGTALAFNVLMLGLPCVLAVRLADLAVDRGAAPWRAYGAAVLGVSVGGAWGGWLLGLSVWGGQPATHARNAWVALSIATLYALGVAAYVHWRRAQQRLARLHRAETERARQEQALQVQRLLALQAQVEPQLLFDTLRRVLDQVPRDPAAADALLAELIALLRAMLPRATAPMSTVQRELALLRSYATVAGVTPPRLDIAGEAAHAELAPMLALPLTRLLQAALGPQVLCRIAAVRDGERLRLSWSADDDGSTAPDSTVPFPADELLALRERLAALYGPHAALHAAPGGALSLVLELPCRPDPPPPP